MLYEERNPKGIIPLVSSAETSSKSKTSLSQSRSRRGADKSVRFAQTASNASADTRGGSAPTRTVPSARRLALPTSNSNVKAASDFYAINTTLPSPSVQPPYPIPLEPLEPSQLSDPSYLGLSTSAPPNRGSPLSHLTSPTRKLPQQNPRNHPGVPRVGRLWNPTNSTPRASTTSKESYPESPIKLVHPQISSPGQDSTAGGDYPLLSAQEKRASRLSNDAGSGAASLQVEYSRSSGSQQRISLPKSIRSLKPGDLDKGKGKEVDRDTTTFANYQVNTSGEPVIAGSGSRRHSVSSAHIISRNPSPSRGRKAVMMDEEQGPSSQTAHRPSDLEGIGPAISLSSAQSSIHGSEIDPDAADQNLEWGPAHPCYPHLNPHVPLSSPEYASTRIIRIRRDWMLEGDLAPTFSGLYPEILADAGLGEGEFRKVVEDLNKQLIPAFDPYDWRNILDAILGLATGWIWDDLGLTAAKKRLRAIEEALVAWNKKAEREGSMASFVGLRRTGYLTLDIQIPTPQIGEATEDEDSRPNTVPEPYQNPRHAEPEPYHNGIEGT